MAKITKHAEVLNHLHSLVTKEAELAKEANPTATGKPGGDVKAESVSESTEHVDKNNVGPEKLGPQHHEQHKATDPSVPVAKAASEKSATAIGQEVLAMISEFTKQASKPTATGKPGGDVKAESVSESTETVDKNSVGPDKLGPQKYEQHKATDPSTPVAKAAAYREEASKIASFELGRTLANAFLKTAAEQEYTMYKEAGRRDFETMIAQAASELEYNEKAKVKQAASFIQKRAYNQAVMQKQAEAEAEQAGASSFQEMLKQAQLQYAFGEMQKRADVADYRMKQAEAQINEIAAREAAYANHMAKQAADQAEMAKFAAIAEYVKNEVLSGLKQEVAK